MLVFELFSHVGCHTFSETGYDTRCQLFVRNVFHVLGIKRLCRFDSHVGYQFLVSKLFHMLDVKHVFYLFQVLDVRGSAVSETILRLDVNMCVRNVFQISDVMFVFVRSCFTYWM